jgi:hypothetical protein
VKRRYLNRLAGVSREKIKGYENSPRLLDEYFQSIIYPPKKYRAYSIIPFLSLFLKQTSLMSLDGYFNATHFFSFVSIKLI